MNKELLEIKANIEKLDKEYRQSKGYSDSPANPSSNEMEDRMYQICSNIYRYVDSVASQMYNYQDNHSKGHLPPIVGAEKMNKALKACGMDGDYQAQPKTLYAQKIRGNKQSLEVDLNLPKKPK